MTFATATATRAEATKTVPLNQSKLWDSYFSQVHKGNLLDELEREPSVGKNLGFSATVSFAQTVA